MLQALGQALRPCGRVFHPARGHRAADGQELGLHPGADPARTHVDQRVQAADGPFQASKRRRALLATRVEGYAHVEPTPPESPGSEFDDRSHC